MVETMRKMKDSGIEWIGEIPEDWKVLRIKYLASGNLQYGANESGINFDEELPRYIRITDIAQDNTLKNDEMLSLENDKAEKYILNDGDILFARSGATAGKSFYYRKEYGYACYAGYLIRLVVDSSVIDSKLVYYYTLTSSYEDWINQIFIQATIQNVSAEKYNNLYIPVSEDKEEQQKIVDYLNKKCAEIDSVIKSKEMTNEKLKEYRQSIIYETVTKGLDKNVPMKDSGIEWIEEIPEEWNVKELRYIFEFGTGLTITRSELLDEGIPCINYGEIHSKYGFDLDLSRDYLKYADKNLLASKANCIVKNGDFIFCDTSEDIEGSGNCVYISNSNNHDIFAGSHTIIGRLTVDINSRYLAYLFGTNSWRAQIRSLVYGVKVFSITQSILKKAKAIVPPTKVQNQIADYLDKKCAEIDSVISANEITIKKLKEYRQSVIFEAVTGKMDIKSLS